MEGCGTEDYFAQRCEREEWATPIAIVAPPRHDEITLGKWNISDSQEDSFSENQAHIAKKQSIKYPCERHKNYEYYIHCMSISICSHAANRSVLASIKHPPKRTGGSNTLMLERSLNAFRDSDLKQSTVQLNQNISTHLAHTQMRNAYTCYVRGLSKMIIPGATCSIHVPSMSILCASISETK